MDINRGEIYQDFTDGNETRRGMWALEPTSELSGDDLSDLVNEEFVQLVEKRKNFVMRRPIFSMFGLTEEFKKCVEHLPLYLKKTKDPEVFYENLLSLQEYVRKFSKFDAGLNEDGSSLRSTMDSLGRDDFPPYDNYDSSPSIENDLNANSALYESAYDKPAYHLTTLENAKQIEKQGFTPGISGKVHFSSKPDNMNIKGRAGHDTIITTKLDLKNPAPNDKFDEFNDYLFNKYDPKNTRLKDWAWFHGQEFKDLEKERDDWFEKNGYDSLITPRDIWVFNPEVITILGVNNKSELSEDLEYNHVDDATQDQYMLSEEQLRDFVRNTQRFEIFKNPKSMKNLKPRIRGIISHDGDLFVINDDWYVIHNDFAAWLRLIGIKKIPEKVHNDLYYAVPVQRYGTTNEFFLGETIDEGDVSENEDGIKRLFQLAKEKNPSFDFVLESILNVGDGIMEARKKSSGSGSKTVKVKRKCQLAGLGNTSVACNQGDINNLEFGPVKEDRKKAWIPGSKAVTVKKKCRIGGLPDGTSVACNQGDINNLEFSSLDETLVPSGRDYWAWVSPDDKFIQVPKLRHKEYIEKHYPDLYWDMDAMFEQAFKDGWVRVIYEYDKSRFAANLSLNGYTRERVKDVLKKLFLSVISYGNNTITLGYENPDSWENFSTYNQETKAKLADFIAEEIKLLRETTQGGGYMMYHGSPNKIDKFTDEYVDQDATDEEGPGIYFTNSYDDARGYGPFVHTVRLSPRKLTDTSSFEDVSKEDLKNLIKLVPDWEMEAQNYAEDPEAGLEIAVDDYYDSSENQKDLFQNIWYAFFRYNPQPFVKGMVQLGYDGQIVDGYGGKNKHIIVYNPEIIEIQDVEENPINEEMVTEADIMSLQELPFKNDVLNANGEIYSVGGAVRDEFLGKESKDLDILVTGVPMDRLSKIMSQHGKVNAVGQSYGILKFTPPGGEEVDVAVPRTEKATGAGGHTGFDVSSDHKLPLETDLKRRDFTINAMAKDMDGNIIDPFGGQQDLKNKTIKLVNPEAFADDPLRMLRAVQFASRFGFEIEPKTLEMIKVNSQRITEIVKERILIEFDKIIKKGNVQTGIELLRNTGLFKHIFGFKLRGHDDWSKVKTMGEFMYKALNTTSQPAEHFKTDFKGDVDTYKEIKALDIGHHPMGDAPVNNRSLAHNMYVISPKTLESKILPQNLQRAAMELLMGRFPKTVGELAVSGNDLMQVGLQGKEIGDKLKSLLINVYAENVRNEREELLNLIGKPNAENINEGESGEEIAAGFNEKIKAVYDKAMSKGFVLLPKSEVQQVGGGVSSRCETNVYKFVKQDPERYFPVGGWMIQYESSLMEHWWVYDAVDKRYLEVSPMGDDQHWLTGYLGIVNYDVNDKIVNSKDFYNGPDFLKGGHVFYNYIKEARTLNESKYTDAKASLKRSKSIPKEMKEEIEKHMGGGSSYHEGGRVHGLTIPKVKGKKFKGVGLGADKKGFYVYTHRAASKRYASPDKIPQKDIDFIESTG